MSHKIGHAKKSRSETRLPPEEDPEFQIAPMIYILLVLLVFFMSISSTEVLQKTEGVTLPVAKDAKPADKNTKGQTIVNILWAEVNNSGTILLDEKKYAQADQMVPVLRASVQANPAVRILIRADKKVRYEFLKQVMIAAGTAGVGNVTFSVVDKDPGAAGPRRQNNRNAQRKEHNMGGSVGSDDGDIGFQIAPMVDVVFVLMLFFMASAGSQIVENELNISLPSGAPPSSTATAKTPIIIDISAEGQVVGNNQSFGTPTDKTLTPLRDWLKSTQGFGGEDPVIIRPNSETRHERIVDVLNACAAAGVKNLTFS